MENWKQKHNTWVESCENDSTISYSIYLLPGVTPSSRCSQDNNATNRNLYCGPSDTQLPSADKKIKLKKLMAPHHTTKWQLHTLTLSQYTGTHPHTLCPFFLLHIQVFPSLFAEDPVLPLVAHSLNLTKKKKKKGYSQCNLMCRLFTVFHFLSIYTLPWWLHYNFVAIKIKKKKKNLHRWSRIFISSERHTVVIHS